MRKGIFERKRAARGPCHSWLGNAGGLVSEGREGKKKKIGAVTTLLRAKSSAGPEAESGERMHKFGEGKCRTQSVGRGGFPSATEVPGVLGKEHTVGRENVFFLE